MKRIVSLFIFFLFLFNLVPYAFAVETKTVNINSFDEFSLEQVQKTFSSNLTQEKNANTKSEKEVNNILFCDKIIFDISSSSFVNLKNLSTLFFCHDFVSNRLNYLYQYKLFEKTNSIDGICEYKIVLNTYMAVALFDMVGFAYNI